MILIPQCLYLAESQSVVEEAVCSVGYAACEHVNPALIGQEHYELTTELLEAVLEVQLNARMREADLPKKLALM